MGSSDLIMWLAFGWALPCLIAEVFLVIFFFSNFLKSTSKYKSAYFIFLFMGYSMEIIYGIIRYTNIFYPTPISTLLSTWYTWYGYMFAPIWTVLLACNRCTAIVAPIRHQHVSFLILTSGPRWTLSGILISRPWHSKLPIQMSIK